MRYLDKMFGFDCKLASLFTLYIIKVMCPDESSYPTKIGFAFGQNSILSSIQYVMQYFLPKLHFYERIPHSNINLELRKMCNLQQPKTNIFAQYLQPAMRPIGQRPRNCNQASNYAQFALEFHLEPYLLAREFLHLCWTKIVVRYWSI